MNKVLTETLSFKLLNQLYAHDRYTFLHSLRVADLLVEFSKFIGLSSKESDILYELGVLHDIGKLKIEASVLNKTSPLLSREKQDILLHPVYGYQILKENSFEHPNILEGVLYHHENIDGSGYPEGLTGIERIPFYAQMLRIVDSFDAMTSQRSYQQPLSYPSALQELEQWKTTWYNPKLLDLFISMIRKKVT